MDTANNEINEPPERCSSIVFVGRNSRGQWVVQDETGLFGGLFVDRKSALHFALDENGRRHESIVFVPQDMELDLARTPHHSIEMPLARVA